MVLMKEKQELADEIEQHNDSIRCLADLVAEVEACSSTEAVKISELEATAEQLRSSIGRANEKNRGEAEMHCLGARTHPKLPKYQDSSGHKSRGLPDPPNQSDGSAVEQSASTFRADWRLCSPFSRTPHQMHANRLK